MVIRGEFSALREGRSPERKAENSRGRLSAGSVRSEIFVFHDACLHPGIHGKLVANHGPVGCRTVCPFFVKLRKPKTECVPNGVLTGEGSFFDYLSKAGIRRLNRGCSVHELPNRVARRGISAADFLITPNRSDITTVVNLRKMELFASYLSE